MDFLEHLTEAYRVSKSLESLQGRAYGLVPGIVTDREDPLGLGRIQVTTGAQGGKSNTDWLTRVVLMPGISPPVPQPGETVLVGFEDGDPQKGYYLGSLQNFLNPAFSPDDLVVRVGQTTLVLSPSRVTLVVQDGTLGETSTVWTSSARVTTVTSPFGSLTESLTSETVEYEGVKRFKINGKQISRRDAGDPIANDLDPYDNPLG